jgi:hypothetical protein
MGEGVAMERERPTSSERNVRDALSRLLCPFPFSLFPFPSSHLSPSSRISLSAVPSPSYIPRGAFNDDGAVEGPSHSYGKGATIAAGGQKRWAIGDGQRMAI